MFSRQHYKQIANIIRPPMLTLSYADEDIELEYWLEKHRIKKNGDYEQ